MLADSIVALGVNHKTAPVEIREKLTFPDDCKIPLQKLENIPGCEEYCFLSTCNRVEVIFVARDAEKTIKNVLSFLFAKSGLSEQESRKYCYIYQGSEAILHLFRVASSLDSMVVGEPQILGQLKDAYREAMDFKSTGVIMNRLMNKAFSVAKRIRTETNIGSSAVSISFAAVQLAKKIFGNLDAKKVMLVGAGEMAELAAEHLINQGVAHVVVANRTIERAMKLARRFNGSAVALGELVPQLENVDILISSTGSPDLVLTRDDIKPIMRKRRHSPLFLIDIAVPRDLDPKINDLDNVYLYDIDDLNHVVEINKAERDKEALVAERIVKEENLKFLQWLENMEVSPTIVAIRKKAEELREQELARTLSQLHGLSTKEKKSIEMLSSALINKLLHNPILFLKAECSPDEKEQKLDLTRKLFGLDANHSAKNRLSSEEKSQTAENLMK